ncbi:MAG: DUF3576 domain-containing protein [Hyphomonadaceae bacterium]|nr:MAG: hypothetical protein FD160_2706 [Caulobacteraceae bacterium]MBT9446064.1 DUF3576 domain-containing protein [Hyphomonadaceae bacterium]TPW04546.1 MAG: hypothetical protein FD124_2565 [Alphaproteobacteria bacterium]
MTRRGRNIWPAAAALALVAGLGACASKGDSGPNEAPRSRTGVDDPGTGISVPFFGGGGNRNQQANQIGVNSFLWRAALDTLSFMPLASNDPFGGVIITDWRTDPNAPTERFKMTVYILDTRLRADGVKVNVFKQVNGVNGWVDAAVDPDTPIQIENAILTRARQLRLSTLGEK